MPRARAPQVGPVMAQGGAVRTDRRPNFRRQPTYAATATPTGSEIAKSSSSGKSIGIAIGGMSLLLFLG